MTSETKFATSFTSVWREVTPLSDGYWAVENMLTRRIVAPMPNKAPKGVRGAVNELAFIGFSKLANQNRRIPRDEIITTLKASISEVVSYINRLSPNDLLHEDAIDDVCLREAMQLTLRLLNFFPSGTTTQIRPKFKGCGIVNACEGDVISRDLLIEVKAGDRGFRVSDLRQLLVYSALAYASDENRFTRIGLFNPRTGMAWSKSLDEVCMSISGLRANDVLPKLVDHMQVLTASS
jgi:hypothetical protein